MTDLTTMHLKCLLSQATPGPWEYDPGAGPLLARRQAQAPNHSALHRTTSPRNHRRDGR